MIKRKRILRKGEFVYSVMAWWLLSGILIALVVMIPDTATLVGFMARVAYGLVCTLTVWVGVLAWYRLRDYVDAMYAEYIRRQGADKHWGEVVDALRKPKGE